jgi:hypothetical protein
MSSEKPGFPVLEGADCHDRSMNNDAVPPPIDGLTVNSPEGRQVANLIGEVPVALRWPEDEDGEVNNLFAQQLGPELRRRLSAVPELVEAANATRLVDYLDELATSFVNGQLDRDGHDHLVEQRRTQIHEWIEESRQPSEIPGLNRSRDRATEWVRDWPEPQ